jgi:hypothetical protein
MSLSNNDTPSKMFQTEYNTVLQANLYNTNLRFLDIHLRNIHKI